MNSDVSVQWMEAESRSPSNDMIAYYKKLKVTAKKRYRSVKIKRPDRTLVCGLGDFVHLESGFDEAPYVARVVALYEDENGRKPYAIVQWLYRDSDLVNPPSDVQKNELFFTVHNDPNMVDVITEVVRIGLVHPDGTTRVSHLYADDTGDETAPSSPRYQLSRVYEHNKHKLGYLSEFLIESLERFNDSTANASLSLYSSLQKKRTLLHASGTTDTEISRSPTIDSTAGGSVQDSIVAGNEEQNTFEEIVVVGAGEATTDHSAVRSTKRSRKSSVDTLDNEQKLPSQDDVHLQGEKKTPESVDGVKDESPESSELWSRTKAILTYVHTYSSSETGEIPPSIADAVKLADRIEHALKCRDSACVCEPDKKMLEHFAKGECTTSYDCEECMKVLEASKVHACRCQALLGLCPMPRCREFKPSRWMAHALSCTSRECDSMLCSKMRSLAHHASQCTQAKSEIACEECRDYYLVIKLHSIGCADGLCHFPNCPHFHEVLEHLRRREPKCRNAEGCLECFTFFRIQALHFDSCNGEVGKCFFPRCEGKKQPVTSGRSSQEMLRQLRVVSKRQVPIGTDHQAAIQPLLDRVKNSPESTEFGERLWSPDLASESELFERSKEIFQAKLKVEPGAVFHVCAPDPLRPKERRYMLCRVLEAPDLDGLFLCTPFDVAWPRKKNASLNIQEIPYPLLYRFHTSDIVMSENYLERAMHSFLTKPVENYSYETIGNIVEKWSKSEYEDLCEVLLDAYKGSTRPGEVESDWLDDAIAVFGQSKSANELTAFWYGLAKGVANSPPGSILCSKCQTEDVKHVCKQYFSCRTGLCPVCFLDVSNLSSASTMKDEVESLLWFCDACVEGKPSASNTTHGWRGCNLVTPNDGYDEALAWKPRLRAQGKVLQDALSGLDQVLYQYSTESYEKAIQVLLKYGGKSSSEEELEKELVAIDAAEGRTTIRQLLGKFWPV